MKKLIAMLLGVSMMATTFTPVFAEDVEEEEVIEPVIVAATHPDTKVDTDPKVQIKWDVSAATLKKSSTAATMTLSVTINSGITLGTDVTVTNQDEIDEAEANEEEAPEPEYEINSATGVNALQVYYKFADGVVVDETASNSNSFKAYDGSTKKLGGTVSLKSSLLSLALFASGADSIATANPVAKIKIDLTDAFYNSLDASAKTSATTLKAALQAKLEDGTLGEPTKLEDSVVSFQGYESGSKVMATEVGSDAHPTDYDYFIDKVIPESKTVVPKVTKIEIKNTLTDGAIPVYTGGQGVDLNVDVTADEGADKTLEFSSNKTTVATVDSNGHITPLVAGEAIITVKSKATPSVSATVKVVVKTAYVETLTIVDKDGKTVTSLNMHVGDPNVTLSAVIKPDEVTNKNVTWTSNNTRVATVSNGVVTAVGSGEAEITAKSSASGATGNKVSTSISVSVTKGVTAISLDSTQLDLAVGQKGQLTATVIPNDATNINYTLSSDKPAVVAIEQDGKIEAKAPGVAIITATSEDGGKTATCTITVRYTPTFNYDNKIVESGATTYTTTTETGNSMYWLLNFTVDDETAIAGTIKRYKDTTHTNVEKEARINIPIETGKFGSFRGDGKLATYVVLNNIPTGFYGASFKVGDTNLSEATLGNSFVTVE